MATKKPDAAAGTAANHTNETVTITNSGSKLPESATAQAATAPASADGGEAGTAGGQKADIAAATDFDPAGAPVQIVPDVDLNHPAVDNDPRKGTTVDQNRIDFNNPSKTGAQAVAENLREQGQHVAVTKTDGQ